MTNDEMFDYIADLFDGTRDLDAKSKTEECEMKSKFNVDVFVML